MIPKEMIEAAAKAHWEHIQSGTWTPALWDEIDECIRDRQRQTMEAALTAALSVQWRGMEEAPKDGTYIRNLAANGERIQPLAWAWSPNAQMHAWCGVVNGVVLPHDPQPTHWMPEFPLPPPPAQE